MQLLRAGQGRGHRRRHPAAGGLRPGGRRPADPRLGLDVRRDPLRRRAPAGAAAGPSPTPTCATSTRSRPTPRTCCARYRRVLIPEVNLGQLLMLIRARYLIDAVGYDQVRGKPFRIAEIVDGGGTPPRGGPRHDRHRRHGRQRRPRPAAAEPRECRRHPAHPQGLRLGPGGPLVPGLRRLLDPRPDPEGDAGLRLPAREHRVHLRHRLLQPAAVLHEHVRVPHDPRPGARRSRPGSRPRGRT